MYYTDWCIIERYVPFLSVHLLPTKSQFANVFRLVIQTAKCWILLFSVTCSRRSNHALWHSQLQGQDRLSSDMTSYPKFGGATARYDPDVLNYSGNGNRFVHHLWACLAPRKQWRRACAITAACCLRSSVKLRGGWALGIYRSIKANSNVYSVRKTWLIRVAWNGSLFSVFDIIFPSNVRGLLKVTAILKLVYANFDGKMRPKLLRFSERGKGPLIGGWCNT